MAFEAYIDRYGSKVQCDSGDSLRLDSIGRWSSARMGGTMFRRTMDCKVVRVSGQPRFTLVDGAAHHAKASAMAREFFGLLSAGAPMHLSADPDRLGTSALMDRLELAAGWTPALYDEEATRFRSAYPEAIEILPPDRYGDVVLLPALGCPNSTCTFCAFYRERRFRLLSDDDFVAHFDAVLALMGDSIHAKQGIFLGSASALSLGQRVLLSRLSVVTKRLGDTKRGIGAFWDPDHSPERTVAQWIELSEAGLTSAYLGLETGLAPLRKAVGKSDEIERLLGRIEVAREAGIQIGVMVLAGIGERAQLDAHCASTADVVRAMQLGPTDIVFVSPLRGSRPQTQLDEEATQLHAALKEHTTAKVAPYAAERFYYYAS